MTAVSYEDGKVITQETTQEPLDEDPSEGQDWNWKIMSDWIGES